MFRIGSTAKPIQICKPCDIELKKLDKIISSDISQESGLLVCPECNAVYIDLARVEA